LATKINGFDLVKVGQGWELAPKSTLNTRLRSVGKNIIDPMRLLRELQKQHPNGSTDVYLTTYNGRPAIYVNNPNLLYGKRTFKGCFKPNTQYTSQITVTHVQSDLAHPGAIFKFVYDDGTYSCISYDGSNNNTIEKTIVTSASGKSIIAIECTYSTGSADTYIYIDDLQIEQGTTATSYEPYKESVSYITLPDGVDGFHSLPNGTKDEVSDGKLYKRVANEGDIIKSATSWTVANELTNTIRFYKSISSLSIPSINSLTQLDGKNMRLILDGVTFPVNTTVATVDTDSEMVAMDANNFIIRIDKTKLSTLDSAGVEAYLNQYPVTLNYQLAQEKTYDLNVTPLIAFENGTVIIEPFMNKKFTYSAGISWDIPVSSIETIEKVATGEFITDYTLASDGLSVTITGATDGEEYIVKASIRSEYSTIPSFSAKYPLNRASQSDSNTIAIAKLSDIVSDILIRI
jgi:hypothetical protein